MKDLDFPSLTNFLICGIVTLSGLYWLRNFSKKYLDRKRYLFRSYFCWWLSWVVWTVTWGIITFTDWEKTYQRGVLALSDMNAILLILVYFCMTRGDTYKPIDAVIEFVYLCAVIASGYLVFLWLLPQRFDHLQMGWGLCLSAVSTLLMGLAFAFRYKTRAVLIIGFVYAFSQPLAFDAILHDAALHNDPQSAAPVLGAFKFVLAIFKVLWATVVTVHLTQVPLTKRNLVINYEKGKLLPSLKKLPVFSLVQTLLLIGAIIVLTSIIFFTQLNRLDQPTKDEIKLILTALGLFLSIIGILTKAFKLFRDAMKREGRHHRPAT